MEAKRHTDPAKVKGLSRNRDEKCQILKHLLIHSTSIKCSLWMDMNIMYEWTEKSQKEGTLWTETRTDNRWCFFKKLPEYKYIERAGTGGRQDKETCGQRDRIIVSQRKLDLCSRKKCNSVSEWSR